MSIAVISDLHVHDDLGVHYQLLLKFLQHPQVQSAQEIILLGDIFDFFCGDHRAYIDKYPKFFQLLASLVSEKKIVRYFEGNHDFEFDKLIRNYLLDLGLDDRYFYTHSTSLSCMHYGEKYYFSHGDEFVVDDLVYPIYKKILFSSVPRFLINNVFNYKLLNLIGQNASLASQYRHQKKDYNFDELMNSIRENIYKKAKKEKLDWVICGHFHIMDEYIYKDPYFQFNYLNCGFPPENKQFILLEKGKAQFIYC